MNWRIVTLKEKRQPKLKRSWLRFSLRSLLILVTLIAVALCIYEPITLHFKAVHFFKIENTIKATRPHPGKLLYNIQGYDNTIVCHVGKVKIVLLERTHPGGTGGFIPVTGDTPQQGGNASVNGEVYFSYSYAEGKTECVVYGFPFLCREGTVEIKEQSFDIDTPTVVLVDTDDQILRTYSQ